MKSSLPDDLSTRNTEPLWATLLDNDVDLINMDDLERLSKFPQSRQQAAPADAAERSESD